jgi:hypothetical protein
LILAWLRHGLLADLIVVSLCHAHGFEPLSEAALGIITVHLRCLLGDLSSIHDLGLHGLIQVVVNLEVVLRVPVWLLDTALVKLVNVIESLNALRIRHLDILAAPEHAAHRGLLLAVSVCTVASTETSCRHRGSFFETISDPNLGTFLSVECSRRSLDDISRVVRGYNIYCLASFIVGVA